VQYPSGRRGVPPAVMGQSLELGPDGTVLHPGDALRELAPHHPVFETFRRMHTSVIEFATDESDRVPSAGPAPVTAATPAPIPQEVLDPGRRPRGGFGGDFMRTFKSSRARDIYQVLIGSKREPAAIPSDEPVSSDESVSPDEGRD
jgi:hypothetical protein